MHAPNHSGALPEGVDPIPIPDTPREAEMLLILLEAGLYPKCGEAGSSEPRKNRYGRGEDRQGEDRQGKIDLISALRRGESSFQMGIRE